MDAANRTTAGAVLSSACFVVACAMFAWGWSDYRAYWLDDAFITFRYASNLAQGFGPVYNVGEFVEGYTSFLWMLVSAVPLALLPTASALTSIKLFGFAASIWVIFRVWTFPSPDAAVRRYWVLVLATQPIFILNSGDGMETPLFMVAMVECLRGLQRTPDARGGTLVGLSTAAMTLTRPESLPLLVVLPALVFVAHRNDATVREGLRVWFRRFVVFGVGLVVVHELFRLGYYGQPFPNTYYAKATGLTLDRLASGLRDLGRFAFENPWRAPVALWVSLAMAGISTVALASRRDARTVVWLAGLWLMIGFRVSFDLWSGSDTMGRHRFLAPLLVPLMILADEGARFLWRGAGRALVVGLCGLCLFYNVTGHLNHAWSIGEYRKGLSRAHVALGLWLRENYPDDSLLAIGDAGAVPFYSRMKTVDLWGLNDSTIAHMPGEYGAKEGMADYVLGREPRLIVLWNQVAFVSEGKGQLVGGNDIDAQLARHPEFRRDFRFVKEYVFRRRGPGIPGYYLDVFERRP